ncbi:sialidase family protein [Spongiactinospora gelatinilytica]|uniref:sialidase family protein n=1 Tax=Spongiactinospora gelatinilytica TaxID=2666298 RepID=UPI001F1AA4C8|nr:sialidase family protein [Spongiactinospora gelatinilytica]
MHAVAVDTRGRPVPRLLAAIEYGHFGPSVMWSDDLGESWQEADRPPVAFPEGGGGLCLHTVLPHPADPGSIAVAVSAAGFYRSTDGGARWEAANRGIRVAFRPRATNIRSSGSACTR